MKYDPKTLKEIWKRVKAQLKRDGTENAVNFDDGTEDYFLRQVLHYTEEVNSENNRKHNDGTNGS